MRAKHLHIKHHVHSWRSLINVHTSGTFGGELRTRWSDKKNEKITPACHEIQLSLIDSVVLDAAAAAVPQQIGS
jgi:hypothetical protein